MTLDDDIAGVRDEFVSDGRRRCAALLSSFGAEFDAEATCKIAHRWAGMGGSLGLPDISRAARALERMLLTGQPIPPPVVERRLRELAEMFAAA